MPGEVRYLEIKERKFVSRGGVLYGDDDFVVVELSCCGTQCLYNEETLQLYLDPRNLKTPHLLIEGEPTPACPGCGATDWEFGDTDLPLDRIRRGAWGWLIDT